MTGFESLTVLLLLPLFFAYTGLRTRIGQIEGPGMWWICFLIVTAAVVGKLGGASVAARIAGVPWRQSLALEALMNTRGLMELVVLNIGLDIGVILPPLFFDDGSDGHFDRDDGLSAPGMDLSRGRQNGISKVTLVPVFAMSETLK